MILELDTDSDAAAAAASSSSPSSTGHLPLPGRPLIISSLSAYSLSFLVQRQRTSIVEITYPASLLCLEKGFFLAASKTV